MPRQEHLRHRAPLPILRPGVLGIFKQSPREGKPTPRFGWEGRMIIAGVAGAVGIAGVAYSALAIYLWWRVARDWVIGWSARHPAINR